MSQEYVFENEDFKKFKECTDEEKLAIIKAKEEGLCEHYSMGSGLWNKGSNDSACFNHVYRALKPAPIPNEIDWSQFPDWVKSCATNLWGTARIYDSIAEISESEGDWLHGDGFSRAAIDITQFPGFKRGTVSWENSLLVKPEENNCE